ncbi:hypothetical protein F4809DRAFT_603633 [Biscogniauxia mediterranea]|nr:hypothetical protein F4809DRAFT_603633 [Biscogniauxia mediterranea]
MAINFPLYLSLPTFLIFTHFSSLFIHQAGHRRGGLPFNIQGSFTTLQGFYMFTFHVLGADLLLLLINKVHVINWPFV